MIPTVTGRTANPMGHVIWHTTRGDYAWFGPGSRLILIIGSGRSASLITIDNPVAHSAYDSERDARAALARFLATFADDLL